MTSTDDPDAKGGADICPVTYAMEIFGDRWTLSVLREAVLEGTCRYRAFQTAIPGIATNVLADRLKRLERRGFLSRERDPEDARQFLYGPTELAISTIPMLVEIMVWSARQGNQGLDPAFIRRFETDRQDLIEELQEKARRAIAASRTS